VPVSRVTNTHCYGNNLAGTQRDMPAGARANEARRVQEEGEQMELGMYCS